MFYLQKKENCTAGEEQTMDNLVEKFNISMTPLLSQSVAWMMSHAYNVDQNIILHCLVNTFDFFIDISGNFTGNR